MSSAGDILVNVGADLSALDAALATAVSDFSTAGKEISDSFDSIAIGDELAISLAALDDHFGKLGAAATDATPPLTDLSDTLNHAGGAAGGAVHPIEDLAPPIHEAGDAAHEAEGKLAEMLEELKHFGEGLIAIEALKEFATEALNTFAAVEKTTIALTAMTGSAEGAEETISKLKDLAMSEALSFPQLTAAAQKMTALGFSAEEMEKALRTAADVAAGTGNSFDAVTNAIDRMALSGMAGGRQLATLGINADTLGKAFSVLGPGMEKTAEEAAKAFKALDQSDRLEVLNEALKKFSGTALAVAGSVSGEFQKLKTAVEFAMEEIGKSLADALKPVVADIQSNVIPAFQAMARGITDVGTALGPLVGGILHQAALDFHDLGIAVESVASVVATLLQPLRDLGVVSGSTSEQVSTLYRAIRDIGTLGLAELPGLIAGISAQFKSFGDVLAAVGRIIGDLVRGDWAQLAIDVAAMPKLLNDYGGAIDLAGKVTKDFGITTKGLTGELERAAKGHLSVKDGADAATAAHEKLKTVTDALKGALNDAQVNLIKVSEAFRKHTATAADLKDALDKVDAAQAALAAKLPKLGAEHLSAAKAAEAHADAEGLLNAAAAKFVGPIQNGFSFAIETIAGSHKNAAAAAHAQQLGIEMLVGAMPMLTTETVKATTVTDSLGAAFDNVSTAVGKANAIMDAFTAKIKETQAAWDAFNIDFGLAAKSNGTLAIGKEPVLVQQFHDGELVGSTLLNAPPPTPKTSGGGSVAPVIQQNTISAADTGQLAGLLSQIDADLQSILAVISNLTVTVNDQMTAATALNTTTSTLQTTTAGLQTVATGLTTGLATTADALQTVAAVTAGGTAAMLTGIAQVALAIAPIAAGLSPQFGRVSLAQLGITSTPLLPSISGAGGLQVGTLNVYAPSNDPRVLAAGIIDELRASGLRTG